MSKQLACNRADVSPGGLKECALESGLKVLIAESGGEYFASQAICPHQEVALCEGLYDGTVLTCHQHLWQWDIRTGAPIGLAEAPLECYKTQVEGDAIYVVEPEASSWESFSRGSPKRARAALPRSRGARNSRPAARSTASATRRTISSCSSRGASSS